jgi:hypothetical protein
MINQAEGRDWINIILIFLVILNILGDIGNVAVWLATPSSRALSLNTGFIAVNAGIANTLIISTAILLIVALCYVVALLGLSKQQKWASLLVVAISVINRFFTLVIYVWNIYFFIFLAWTIILIVVALFNYRKISI